jgi:hypothetical protein
LLSASLFALLSGFPPTPYTSSPSILDIARATFLLCPITAVSCGSFGFLAGIAGGTAIYLRRRRIRSTRRLLIECAILGFLLGFLFPLFDHLLNPPSLDSMKLLSAPAGVICALLCAFAFRRRIVGGRIPPHSPSNLSYTPFR